VPERVVSLVVGIGSSWSAVLFCTPSALGVASARTLVAWNH
jgi:hypothetical protein